MSTLDAEPFRRSGVGSRSFASEVREDVEAIERNLDTEDNKMSDETTLADVQRWCEAHRVERLRATRRTDGWTIEAGLTIAGSVYAVPCAGEGPALADAWADMARDVERGAR